MKRESIDYGVCRLSVVAVRSEPAHRAEQISQLLFGDHYEVTGESKDGKWLWINVYYDMSEGWIDASQHHPITKEHYDYINRADFKITTDLATSILYNKSPLLIFIGSIIPISSTELFKMEEQFAFNGDSKSLGMKRDFEFLKHIASKYLNAPFQWGGKSPFGIDAPGFVQMAFKLNGYRLGRTVQEQLRQGKEIKIFSEALPGDVLFFNSNGEKPGHVGILLDDNKVIHAYGKVHINTMSEEGILNPDVKSKPYRVSLIRRILSE